MNELTDEEEVKRVVFGLNADSTGTRWFHMKILSSLLGYNFQGYSQNGESIELPRYITCTNQALY